MTANEIREAEDAVRATGAAYEAALRERKRRFLVAVDEGKTHAWLAGAAGLSRGRIGQIVPRQGSRTT